MVVTIGYRVWADRPHSGNHLSGLLGGKCVWQVGKVALRHFPQGSALNRLYSCSFKSGALLISKTAVMR